MFVSVVSEPAQGPRPRRLLLLRGGATWTLLLYTWLSRRIYAWLKTRTSIYGWALHFGDVRVPIDTIIRENVCVQCGSAFAAEELTQAGRVSTRLGVSLFTCPQCSSLNTYFVQRTPND